MSDERAAAVAVPDVLADLVGAARLRVAEQTAPRRRFSAALAAGSAEGRVSLIAEHKRASPSAGVIRDDLSLADVVCAYERGGAAALSILTEPTRFGGRLADIGSAREASGLPILRKEFIVEPYQVYESAVAGADAILLIVAAFGDPEPLGELLALAGSLGLEVLMEVHDRRELTVARDLRAPIIGINNRNLRTLEVDLSTSLALAAELAADPGVIVVAESGFSAPAEIRALAQAGVDAVLMGEALMRAPDLEAAARSIAAA
ncbi:indole-3-glycerol-phosphate synthase [Conexibacter sp. DBS9H8]|uniref:indole-3-glycerol phosphate synthase TrpC n=1 Tax=Conexibacter sp. DBS9H8 TaxID=2937801 RepID=UPI00200F2554|nr:indole-3-glycerol-phosphate synthase [Conexibacter sp. DBS9H8]